MITTIYCGCERGVSQQCAPLTDWHASDDAPRSFQCPTCATVYVVRTLPDDQQRGYVA